MATTYNAGIVTAYGAAVRGGYTGTYDEFCAEQANFARNAAAAEAAADRAESAVESLSNVATEIYVQGTSLIINTAIQDGNEVSY